jgi:hypothetical protein
MKSGRSNGERHSLLRKERNGLINGSLIGTKDTLKVLTGVISTTKTWMQSIIGVKSGTTKGN